MIYLSNHQHTFNVWQFPDITTETNHIRIFIPEYLYNKYYRFIFPVTKNNYLSPNNPPGAYKAHVRLERIPVQALNGRRPPERTFKNRERGKNKMT